MWKIRHSKKKVKKKAAHIFIQFQTPPPSGLSGGFVISEHGVNGEYIDKD